MKLAIVGPGRSGKDHAAEHLASISTLFYSGYSTSAVILPWAADWLGVSAAEAWETRHADRELWKAIGDELRREDAARLARKTLEVSDICVGIRDRVEMEAVRYEGLVDLVLWIDRDVPPDPTMGYGPEMADVVVMNRWDLASLESRLTRLAASWGVLKPPIDRITREPQYAGDHGGLRGLA